MAALAFAARTALAAAAHHPRLGLLLVVRVEVTLLNDGSADAVVDDFPIDIRVTEPNLTDARKLVQTMRDWMDDAPEYTAFCN